MDRVSETERGKRKHGEREQPFMSNYIKEDPSQPLKWQDPVGAFLKVRKPFFLFFCVINCLNKRKNP